MQTSPDYYSYEPTLSLPRPLVITGHPGSDLREVAYDLAALTGLGVHDLDHRIAHDVGTSTWDLCREQGPEAYLDRAMLLGPALLQSTPSGLVVIGEGMLGMVPALAAMVRSLADLVFLALSSPGVYWRVRRLQEQGLVRHPLLPDVVQQPHDLQPILAACERTVEQADLVLETIPGEVHSTVLALQTYLAGRNPESGP